MYASRTLSFANMSRKLQGFDVKKRTGLTEFSSVYHPLSIIKALDVCQKGDDIETTCLKENFTSYCSCQQTFQLIAIIIKTSTYILVHINTLASSYKIYEQKRNILYPRTKMSFLSFRLNYHVCFL